MANTTIVSKEKTATTLQECAAQRAKNISRFAVKNVLELCVGNSIHTLRKEYEKYGIDCYGNDIDIQWEQKENWIRGDCLKIDYSAFEAVVFAPPLSQGCTGTREDSLMIEQVTPNYYNFLAECSKYKDKLFVMVLPARSLATRQDREQYYKLFSYFNKMFPYAFLQINPLTCGRREIRKYIDWYFLVDKQI